MSLVLIQDITHPIIHTEFCNLCKITHFMHLADATFFVANGMLYHWATGNIRGTQNLNNYYIWQSNKWSCMHWKLWSKLTLKQNLSQSRSWSENHLVSGKHPALQWAKCKNRGVTPEALTQVFTDMIEREYLRWNVTFNMCCCQMNWISFDHLALTLFDLSITAESRESDKDSSETYLFYVSEVISVVTQGFICVSYFLLFFVFSLFIKHWGNKSKLVYIMFWSFIYQSLLQKSISLIITANKT